MQSRSKQRYCVNCKGNGENTHEADELIKELEQEVEEQNNTDRLNQGYVLVEPQEDRNSKPFSSKPEGSSPMVQLSTVKDTLLKKLVWLQTQLDASTSYYEIADIAKAIECCVDAAKTIN